VSILDVGGGTVEVLATGGDAHLGGDDLDRAVAVWLAKEAKILGAIVDPRGALMVKPGRYCDRIPLNSRNEGSQCVG